MLTVVINKPQKRDNIISTYKLSPPNRPIFNVNRQNNNYNDHTVVQSLPTKKSE